MHSSPSLCPYIIYLFNKKGSFYISVELNASKQTPNKKQKSAGIDSRNGVFLQLECLGKMAYEFSPREKQKVTG
jgi:hypothetical protein